LSTAGGISLQPTIAEKEQRHRLCNDNAVHLADFQDHPHAPKWILYLQPSEQNMISAILTFSALGAVVTAGWVIDLLVRREPPTRIEKLMSEQLRRSTDAIRG
jgi:hypothetical protein